MSRTYVKMIAGTSVLSSNGKSLHKLVDSTSLSEVIYTLHTEDPAAPYYSCDGVSGDDIDILVIASSKNGVPVTQISAGAFENATSLTSVVVPNSVTSIGRGAFNGCSKLTSITLPFVGIYRDGAGAFALIFSTINDVLPYMSVPASLKTVTITDCTTLPYAAFSMCSNITNITLPDTLLSIGGAAFNGCSALDTVNIPYGVTSIGDLAFSGCSRLGGISIPDSVTTLGSYAFQRCSGLASITLGTGVTSIGAQAFYGCTSLTKITIPQNVTTLGTQLFNNCTALSNVSVHTENTTYKSAGNCIIHTKNRSVVAGCKSSVIPNDKTVVTTIGEYAFAGCGSLTGITIPSCIAKIDAYAFSDCTGLTIIDLPAVQSIGNYAFSGCSSMISAGLHDSLKKIGSRIFNNCSNIGSVSFAGTRAEWDLVEKADDWDAGTVEGFEVFCIGA